jgi:putative spermidine/putrescine transport system permease protein
LAVDVRAAGSPLRGARLRLSAEFWRRPWLRATGLLAPPLLFFVCIYIAALVVLFVSAFWTTDSFTGKLVHQWTFANFQQLFSTSGPYLGIAGRTIGIAAAVTVTDAVLAFPLAYFMARIAPRRLRTLLFVGVLMPLWSSYLVRVYAWTTILSGGGVLNWALNGIGLPSAHIAYTNWAMWIVFSYVWLPFMVLPLYAAVERIPDSYLEASADLGGRSWRTFRTVVLPLVLPGVVAGSIFTFSLTLGDFITPELVGGPSSRFIGNVVADNTGSNLPLSAAFATVPMLVMAAYLFAAKRAGAFEAL